MGNRAKGEGTIRLRKDGRWEGRYTVGHDPLTGKQIQKNVLAKTQKECKEKLKKAIADSELVDFSRDTDYKISDWMNLWFETYSKPNLKPATRFNYSYAINSFINPRLGKIKLRKFTSLQAQQFINDLKNTEKRDGKGGYLEPKTIKEIFGVLKRALKQAVKDRIITFNPCDGCKVPQVEKKEQQPIPFEKIEEYLRIADKKGYLPLFYLALSTGLRRGEILALKWSDLDLDNKTISVTKTGNRIDGEIIIDSPKTKSSTRTISVSDDVIELLLQEHAKHPTNEYMFPSPVNGAMRDPNAVARTHKKIAKAIGEPDIRFHDLRHTYTTMAAVAGVDIKTISQTLGHSSTLITLDIYSHVTVEMKKDAATKVSALLKQLS